jgi:hypothetical protein
VEQRVRGLVSQVAAEFVSAPRKHREVAFAVLYEKCAARRQFRVISA